MKNTFIIILLNYSHNVSVQHVLIRVQYHTNHKDMYKIVHILAYCTHIQTQLVLRLTAQTHTQNTYTLTHHTHKHTLTYTSTCKYT